MFNRQKAKVHIVKLSKRLFVNDGFSAVEVMVLMLPVREFDELREELLGDV